jgi:hypothetical protein
MQQLRLQMEWLWEHGVSAISTIEISPLAVAIIADEPDSLVTT